MEISSTSTKPGTKARRHSTGTGTPKGLTQSKSNTSGQSQSETTVPHYLRASTGSCHDFCKYGGRNAFEEEKIGTNKKTGSNKRIKAPAWKDIVSYDVVPKISKPRKVPLVSMEISSTRSKPKLIRQTSLERPVMPSKMNLSRRGSMEISSTSIKLVASARPNVRRQASMEISSTSTKPVASARPNVLRQASMEISSSLTKTKIGKPTAPKEVNKAKKINGKKIEERKVGKQKKIGNEIKNETGNEIKNGIGTDNEIGNEIDCGEEKTIYTVNSESPKIDSNLCGNKSNYEKQLEETKPVLSEAIEIIFEKEGIMNDEIFIEKPNECAFSEPVSENNLESMLNEIGEISKSDKDPNTIGEKSFSSSSETSEKSEWESETESESESIDEEEFESESESQLEIESELVSENEQMETDGNKESLKISNRRRRSGVINEEEKAYKLKFKPGRVIELKLDKDTTPKRLKFRKRSESNSNPNSNPSGDSVRKANYKKKSRSRSDCVRPVKADPEPVKSVLLRHQDGQEKKEGQNGLFNNVIEETASKLVESRKSKVKALVGAFETVISLQDGKP